jgi:hypothetical protein
MHHTIGEAQGLISHALAVEEALGLAQIKAVEISTAQSGRWDELVEVAIRTQRCAAPRAFEQRLTILIKYLKSISDDPTRALRDVETEGLAMLAAAKICCEPSNCWSERAKEAIRTVDTSDRSAFEKKLIFRLMYLRDVQESALSNADAPATTLATDQGSRMTKASVITPPPCWESWATQSRHASGYGTGVRPVRRHRLDIH